MARKVASCSRVDEARPSGFPSRFEGSEVYIEKEGDRVVLSPKRASSWREFFEDPRTVSDDFSWNPETCPRRSLTALSHISHINPGEAIAVAE